MLASECSASVSVGHLGLGVRIVSSLCLVCVSWAVFLEFMKALENLSSVRQGSTFCSLSPGTQSSVFTSWKSGIIKNCFFQSSRLNFGLFTPLTVVRKVEWLFLHRHWLAGKIFFLACLLWLLLYSRLSFRIWGKWLGQLQVSCCRNCLCFCVLEWWDIKKISYCRLTANTNL